MGKTATILRASSVMAGVSALAVGVTFAALQSTATLTDNTISSATASLLVDGSDADTVGTDSEAGFSFTGLVPGGDYSEPQTFSLTNNGPSDMQITAYASGGTAEGLLNKNKVHVKFVNTDDEASEPKEYTLAELEAMYNDLPGVTGEDMSLEGDDPTTDEVDGETNTFEVSVKLDDGAVGGGAASLSGFDLTFTGSAVGSTPPATPPGDDTGDDDGDTPGDTPGDETPGDDTGDDTPGDDTGDETPGDDGTDNGTDDQGGDNTDEGNITP